MDDGNNTRITEPRSWWKAILICLPMMVLTAFLLGAENTNWSDPMHWIAFGIAFLFFNALFFLMVYTGKTDRFRAIGFITFAVLLSFTFIVHMLEARGSMSISMAKIIECEVPFCHIVTPMTIIPILLTRSIIFPGQINEGYASIATMFVIIIGASLALGRGFCSWGCFFGGWDDGFSRILKKPLIRKIAPILTYLPFAVLLVVALTAAAALSPTYCNWLCPFKAVTEFEAVTSLRTLVQTVIFVSLFVGLVIVFPLLTKRRTQCGLFCPMGAFESLANKINPFDVRIDPDKCVKCKRCIQLCPTFSLNEKSLETGKPRMTCVKCGKCIDACPKKAVNYHIKGNTSSQSPVTARLLFLFPAFLFMATFAGGALKEGILRIINLIMTGSLI